MALVRPPVVGPHCSVVLGLSLAFPIKMMQHRANDFFQSILSSGTRFRILKYGGGGGFHLP
jgi:hypothetical protein